MIQLSNFLFLSCDKISITWEPKSKAERDALKIMFNIGTTSPRQSNRNYRYYKSVIINGSKVSLAADPRYPNTKFFRIEFNPNFISPKSLSKVLDQFIANFYSRLMLEGTVTRFDLAFDFTSINFDLHGFYRKYVKRARIVPGETYETLNSLPKGVEFRKKYRNKIRYNSARKQIIYTGVMSDFDKQALLHLSIDDDYRQAINSLFRNSQSIAFQQYQTLYYGTRKSECYICVYDKLKQMLAKNQTSHACSKSRIRVEFSIRNYFKLKQLSTIALKYLSKLTVCEYPASPDPSDLKFISFLKKCIMHSPYYALNDLSDYKKPIYHKRLNFIRFADFVGPLLHAGLIEVHKFLLG